MKHLKRSLFAFIILGMSMGPVSPVFAQVSPSEGSADRHWLYGRDRSDIKNKIDTLGTEAVLIMPIPILFGVTQPQLGKNFGDPRSGGRTHEGLDIMAPQGTPIVSPTKAVVTSTGNEGNAGIYVYTANPGGETFRYMHLSSIAQNITSGSVLEPGDLIGFVGNTGNAIGGAPHLHFEIRKDGATDPYPRLTREFTLEERIASTAKFLAQVPNAQEVALFLVTQYRPVFESARLKNIALPPAITAIMGTAITSPSNTSSPTTKYQFSRSLSIGMSGDDVQKLQKFLNQSGFVVATTGVGSPGYETKTFGSLTRAAVVKYQIANNISPTLGFFGPITRSSVNAKIMLSGMTL